MSLSSTKGTYRLTLGDCDLLMADAIFMQRHNIHFIPNPIGKMLGRPQLLQLFPEKKISDTVHLFVFHTSFAERLCIYYRRLLLFLTEEVI